MKFLFSFCFIFLYSSCIFGIEQKIKYIVKTKGIVIGELFWEIKINEKEYETNISLKNLGLLSKIYKFKGNYKTQGQIINNELMPKQYEQYWSTNKKTSLIKITFDSGNVIEVNVTPPEKEHSRINYKSLKNYKDPISSFINILLNKKSSYTIDGRRIYALTLDKEEDNKIIIEKFSNIWADHKRNDLEYLKIEINQESILPKKITIKFKGSLFYLDSKRT